MVDVDRLSTALLLPLLRMWDVVGTVSLVVTLERASETIVNNDDFSLGVKSFLDTLDGHEGSVLRVWTTIAGSLQECQRVDYIDSQYKAYQKLSIRSWVEGRADSGL